MEKAIDEEGTGRLVQLVLDGLAAYRNLDDDVHVIRRIVPDLDRIDPHEPLLLLPGTL